MILLVDANVLIDLTYVEGLNVLCRLGKLEVLDVVLAECNLQKEFAEKIKNINIVEIKASFEWLKTIRSHKEISEEDSLNLYYAKTYSRILLTNDLPLRKLCESENVTCHGTLWILEELYQRSLCPSDKLINWLDILSKLDRRMPKTDVLNLRFKLEQK